MARIFLSALFSLLLVGMQEEALVHAVDHLRAQVQRGHETSLQNAASGDCLECALLVSGSAPAPAPDSAAMPVIGASTRVRFRSNPRWPLRRRRSTTAERFPPPCSPFRPAAVRRFRTTNCRRLHVQVPMGDGALASTLVMPSIAGAATTPSSPKSASRSSK
jgi:hypothetical protein